MNANRLRFGVVDLGMRYCLCKGEVLPENESVSRLSRIVEVKSTLDWLTVGGGFSKPLPYTDGEYPSPRPEG